MKTNRLWMICATKSLNPYTAFDDSFYEPFMTPKTLTRALVRGIGIGTVCAGIFGCAIGQQVPDIRIDGGPLQPAEQAVRLALHSYRSYPGHLNFWWGANIISVDGKPIPQGSDYVQLPPGRHTMQYSCVMKFSLNDLGGATNKGTGDSEFDAGTTYFPP